MRVAGASGMIVLVQGACRISQMCLQFVHLEQRMLIQVHASLAASMQMGMDALAASSTPAEQLIMPLRLFLGS